MCFLTFREMPDILIVNQHNGITLIGGIWDMLEKQVATLTGILKNEDIQSYAGDSFYNLTLLTVDKSCSSPLAGRYSA